MAARAIASGTISFGLVSIPVKLYTAATSEQVRFNMLHEKCGSRIKQQLYCPVDDEIVPRRDTVKGYEFGDKMYVRFDDEELKALEAQRDSSINIVEFVPLSSFDLIQVEKSYYLGPDKGGDKAYRLLNQAMTTAKKVAVGTWASKGKEQLIVIRPYQDGLLFHQLFYAHAFTGFVHAYLSHIPVRINIEIPPLDHFKIRVYDQLPQRFIFSNRIGHPRKNKIVNRRPSAEASDYFETFNNVFKAIIIWPVVRKINCFLCRVGANSYTV